MSRAAPFPPPPRPRSWILLNALDCAFDKQSWHGANLMSAIRGVDAKTAARRVRGRKTIWEQLLHTAYWKHRAHRRIAGTVAFPRPGKDWPPMPEIRDAKQWKADIEMVRETHQWYRDAVAKLNADWLDEKGIWLIQGAAAHDLYHAGQIKLLRRMLGAA
jgi:hypothetical protein